MAHRRNLGAPTKGQKTSAEEDLVRVEQCLQGDWSAFENLYNKYKEKVFYIAYRYVRKREDALDIVQDVFSKVYTSLAKFQQRSSFYTWLCRIAINKSIDYTRSKKNTVSYEPFMTQDSQDGSNPPEKVPPLEEMGNEEFRSAFDEALTRLPDIHKSVFVLYALEDLSYKEIAEVLDCSLGTIMSRLHYARKKLQEILKDWWPKQGDEIEEEVVEKNTEK